MGTKRNYFPDFLIEEKYLIEIKPKYLHSSDNTINKKIGAELYCLKNSLKYKIRDIKK